MVLGNERGGWRLEMGRREEMGREKGGGRRWGWSLVFFYLF